MDTKKYKSIIVGLRKGGVTFPTYQNLKDTVEREEEDGRLGSKRSIIQKYATTLLAGLMDYRRRKE